MRITHSEPNPNIPVNELPHGGGGKGGKGGMGAKGLAEDETDAILSAK